MHDTHHSIPSTKNGVITQHQWLTSIILATQEAERIADRSQPRHIVHKTLSRKKPITKKIADGVAQGGGTEFKLQYHKDKIGIFITTCKMIFSLLHYVVSKNKNNNGYKNYATYLSVTLLEMRKCVCWLSIARTKYLRLFLKLE
jgi:hypothetical protein